MRGKLYLEDGTVFNGTLFGAKRRVRGELVFNTSMTGYQEILTDPSYVHQVVVMTYPLVGNCGFNVEDIESFSPKVSGLVVKELCRTPSNFRSEGNLDDYLEEHGITGLEGVDTRALTLHIREKGSLRGVILREDEAVDLHVLSAPLENPVMEVTTKEAQYHGQPKGLRVAVMDFGMKSSILKQMIRMGYYVAQFPADTNLETILSFHPNGVILSNGPGNPEDLSQMMTTVTALLQSNIPVMGICLGHQLISLAFGAITYKLPFGHRGGNHPVKNLETGKISITSQNHSYAVEESSLPSSLIITHRNLNDGTVEGLKHVTLPVFSVQYHPEASPGPEDSFSIFIQFDRLMKEGEPCR